jgi:hypothetical protein
MRWRSVWLAASSVLVLVLAGCGSSAPTRKTKPPPRIPGNVAQQLAADADAVASASGCAARAPAQKLLNDVITSEAQIPQRYLEQLTSSANDLVSRVPACPPQHDHGKHKGHKKKHDKHDEGD